MPNENKENKENFDAEKYDIKEYSATPKKYGLICLAVLLPYYIICVAVYLLQRDYANIFATVFKATFLLEFFVLMLGVIIVLGIAMFVKAALLSAFSESKSDSLKFRMIPEVQKPHCYAAEPVKIGKYRVCLIAYIFTAALLPYITALITGDFMVVLASFFSAYWAAGDIWLLIALFGKNGGDYIIDFENVMLYRIYENNENKYPAA